MKESFWGTAIVAMGVLAIFFILFFQSVTNTDEHNYHLLKEATEAAMFDALDLAAYRESNIIKIDREKFVENYLRKVRFCQIHIKLKFTMSTKYHQK